jgi:hypothetical protein
MNIRDAARDDVVTRILFAMSIEGCGHRRPLPLLGAGVGTELRTFLLRDAQKMARRDALIKKLIVLCVKIQILQYHMNFERFAMVRGAI